jgi:hypothetical protein
MEYSGSADEGILDCASDAAYAIDSETRRSSEGYLFKLYGGAMNWRAGK